MTGWPGHAPADGAGTDGAVHVYLPGHPMGCPVCEAIEAAEARANELQRERDEQATAAMENYDWGVRLDGELQQARREADQLRAALREHVKMLRGIGENACDNPVKQVMCSSAAILSWADALDAALAGVQADNKDSA